jgi:hypothetical protein
MNDLKEKSKGKIRESSLTFVVPMQLEECMYCLENIRTPDLEIAIPSFIDTDSFNVSMKGIVGEDSVVRVSGSFRRWEGTSTKFNGRMKIISDADMSLGLIVVFVLLPFIGCPLLILLGALTSISETEYSSIFCIASFLGLLMFIPVVEEAQKKIDERLHKAFLAKIYHVLELPTEYT